MTFQVSSDEFVKKCHYIFEYLVPVFGFNSLSAEQIGRLYKYIGEEAVARQYFSYALREWESTFLAGEFQGGKDKVFSNRCHVALLAYYAHDMNKARALLAYAVTELELFLEGHISKITKRTHLGHLLYAYLILGEWDMLSRTLHALIALHTELSNEAPSVFFDLHKSIEKTLLAKKNQDIYMAQQALAELQVYIEEQEIPIDSYAWITARDILELLINMWPALHRGTVNDKVLFSGVNIYASPKLEELFEYTLPRLGLSWETAEQIARIYKDVGKTEAAQRYFKCAADMKKEKVFSLYPQYSDKTHKPFTLIDNVAHVALLYYYAGESKEKQEALKEVRAEADSIWQKYEKYESEPMQYFQHFYFMPIMISYYLIDNNFAMLEKYIFILRKAINFPYAGKGHTYTKPAKMSPRYQAIAMMLQAKAQGEKQLAYEAVQLLRENAKQNDIPIDSIGRISEWDILNLIQREWIPELLN